MHISCRRGYLPIRKGQEWALRVKGEDGFIGFLIMRVEDFENESIAMEVVRAERQGTDQDMVSKTWQTALDQFGYNGKFYFANSRWNVWNEMMPDRV